MNTLNIIRRQIEKAEAAALLNFHTAHIVVTNVKYTSLELRFTVLLFIVVVLTLNKLQINKCLTCLSAGLFLYFYIYN